MEPLVSVIIPVYNVLPYLREALNSVITQTYRNLEILVVDDGSTDGSGEVCDEYLYDPRVIVIHQENKGLSGARNTGLDRMTGEYVAFLDSDDAFQTTMIKTMLDAMIRNRADVATCGFTNCFTELNLCTSDKKIASKKDIYDKELVLSPSDNLNKIISDQSIWAVWNKIYKSTIWTTIRFPEGANFEDMRVMCQVHKLCKRLVTVPGVYVMYRQHSGSITKTQSVKNLRDFLLAVNAIESFAINNCPSMISLVCLRSFQEQYTRKLCTQYAKLLYYSHSSGSLSQIREELILRWKSLMGSPFQCRSRIVYLLFLYAPWLIVPSHACWNLGKRLIGKAIHS